MPVTLKLVTPVKVLPAETAEQITFTASDGEIGVRQGHAPLVALVGFGFVELVGGRIWAVRGGVAQVLNDEVNLLVIDAVDEGRIDAAQVEARLAELAGGGKEREENEASWLKAQQQVLVRRKALKATAH
jgi:F-type H+-transporting ATPase subunit epsilon